jgi:hypothetical protein
MHIKRAKIKIEGKELLVLLASAMEELLLELKHFSLPTGEFLFHHCTTVLTF